MVLAWARLTRTCSRTEFARFWTARTDALFTSLRLQRALTLLITSLLVRIFAYSKHQRTQKTIPGFGKSLDQRRSITNEKSESNNCLKSRDMKSVGKLLLAIVLGYVTLIVCNVALGFLFGLLQRLFRWPMPTPTMLNWILLAISASSLLIYRVKRRRSKVRHDGR